jgi:hypothetical protein
VNPPAGATINSITGLFKWTPSAPGQASITVKATDTYSSPASDSKTFSVTVLNAGPTISPTTDTKSVQYSDPLSYTFTVTNPGGQPITVTPQWKPANEASYQNGVPPGLQFTQAQQPSKWNLTGIANSGGLATYDIRVTVTDNLGAFAQSDLTLNVVPEDAQVSYEGPLFMSAAKANSTSVTFPLKVRVKDSNLVNPNTDAFPGDITKASVKFVDRISGQELGSAPVVAINPADKREGIASLALQVNLAGLPPQGLQLGMVVQDAYGRNSSEDDVLLVAARPKTSVMVGAAQLDAQNSTGTYANTAGKPISLAVSLYKSGGSYGGGVQALICSNFPGNTPHVYRVQATALSNVSVDTPTRTVSFTGLATVLDVTDPTVPPTVVASNVPISLVATDAKAPGVDSYSLSLQGGALFSSRTQNNATVEQGISEGNLLLNHKKAPVGQAAASTAASISGSQPGDDDDLD